MSIERLIVRDVIKLSYDFFNNAPVWLSGQTGTVSDFLKPLSMETFLSVPGGKSLDKKVYLLANIKKN
jgi:hypothetical protein